MPKPGKHLSEKAIRQMFALAVVQCRRKAELSQEALAERSGLSTSYISLLERASRNLTVLSAARIADACNLKLSEFVALAELATSRDSQ